MNYSTTCTNSSGPGGGAFSAISCPAWWGICLFLRAVKTNAHLYPGVGGSGFTLTGALLALGLLDDSEVEINDVLDEGDNITFIVRIVRYLSIFLTSSRITFG